MLHTTLAHLIHLFTSISRDMFNITFMQGEIREY